MKISAFRHRNVYISSLSVDAVERVGHFVRSHWGIENGLHWILDVSMGEDGNRTRCDNGAENLSMLWRLALAILKPVKDKKTIPTLMFQLAIDEKERNNAIKHILMR
jgi:predicted transposase YbfD/YdcC